MSNKVITLKDKDDKSKPISPLTLMEQNKSGKELVHNNILEYIDLLRIDSSRKIHHLRKSVLSQYFSDSSLSRLMASMFSFKTKHIKILDPGAGIGSLFAACVEGVISRRFKPESISITTYEIDEVFYPYLNEVFRICSRVCKDAGIKFEAELIQKDFILDSAEKLGLLGNELKLFNYIIMNPPYGKINVSSKDYKVLKGIGLETTNYYAAFVSIAARLLQEKGEMVSITPRSFCNGPYFESFRKRLFNLVQLKRIHLFKSRTTSFRQDNVLQENIIFYTIKRKGEPNHVIISSSDSPQDKYMTVKEVQYNSVISPDDQESFIRIIPDDINSQIADKMSLFKNKLEDLNLHVSTGKIVDFRATKFLRQSPSKNTVPLIHPGNLRGGFVKWPLDIKKPTSVEPSKEIKNQLIPRGNYVLTKRFTTNEERKRIVASIFDADRFDFPFIGLENRVNYFHKNGKGMDMSLAKGLTAFLNSTLVDLFFRQFNGHTQVNATDLRNLYYPTEKELKSLGKNISDEFPDQTNLDKIIERQLLNMSENEKDPVAAKRKLDESLSVLKLLGLPREQHNERSALTLLSLLELKPNDLWSKAKSPLCGITPMMEFFNKYYGKKYAPNSRETVRRFTVHQFLQAGIIVENPDDPLRPTNSPKAVYQIENGALELLRTFGTMEWDKNLQAYIATVKTLKERYAREREMQKIHIKFNKKQEVNLSTGGQNILVEKIIKEFAPRFAPESTVLYIGDTGEKFAYFDGDAFKDLAVEINPHGKMPDVIIYHRKKNWLLLIEAVTSHGPVSAKRRDELQRTFAKSNADLVYITTFLDRASLMTYLKDIAWETEVWVADTPSHMIHFNGERFLGPY